MRRANRCGSRRRSRGLALMAVLWIVSALSLLVTALISTIKTEVTLARQHQGALQAQASGDALILQTLQALHAAAQTSWESPVRLQQSWAGQVHAVELRPASGWIDINTAPAPLLAALMQHAAGLDADQSQRIAEQIVAERERTSAGITARFDSGDDLMRVPGIPVDKFARIRPALTVNGDPGGKVNPMAAPAEVLGVLAEGRPDRVAPIVQAQQRQMGEPLSPTTVDTSFMNPAFIHTGAQPSIRLSVEVGRYTRVWWVRWGEGTEPLPWRVLDQQTLAVPTPN